VTYIYEKGYIIADILTFLRLIISLFLFVLALGGRTTFDYFMSLVLFAWATDALDGYFARKSGHPGKFGRREGWVDWVFYIACLLFNLSRLLLLFFLHRHNSSKSFCLLFYKKI